MAQSRVEDLSPVVKKVSVELGPDRVKDALDRAYTGLSRTVKLKGYRAGHVPRRPIGYPPPSTGPPGRMSRGSRLSVSQS